MNLSRRTSGSGGTAGMESTNGQGDDQESPYLTLGDAARLMQVSITTLSRWAADGRLPYRVIDGEKWVARQDLEAIAVRLPNPHG